MKQVIIDIGPVTCKYFLLRTNNIFSSNITCMVVNQKHFKTLFHLIKSSTQITEFGHVKFAPNIDLKILEIDSNNMFSKKRVLQKRKFSCYFFFSQ